MSTVTVGFCRCAVDLAQPEVRRSLRLFRDPNIASPVCRRAAQIDVDGGQACPAEESDD
ncbi:MAG: hypothetical protein JWM76_3865 [Pseudonocardiales bacterium]|nr:hypothetical protein [Pseudonocardiales bacterium]